MPLVKDGVELVAKGVTKFLSDMNKAEGAYAKAAKTFDGDTKQVSKGFGDLGAVVSSVFGGAIGGIAVAAVSKLTSVFKGLVDIGKQVMNMLTKIAQEGLMLAGRFQETEFSALAIGRAMGKTEKEIRDAIDAINEAGVRYDVAAETVAKLSRYQIDLANSADLVRVAQATGILIDEDSSETMARLTDAIVTGNSARLTALQIQVDFDAAEKKLATQLGKTTKALSTQEQMQARTNAIIEQSAGIMDVYAAAMESPTKRLRSLTGREIPELQAGLMQAFLPAFSAVIGDSNSGIRGLVSALTEATKEGGALYPTLVKLGAAAALLADAFSYALTWIGQNLPAILGYIDKVAGNLLLMLNPALYVQQIGRLILGMDNAFNEGFEETAVSMFRWGAEIVAALAEGMVSAAHQAMQVMTNVISNLLSFWFAPGSDPNIAPFSVWGKDYIAQLLHGMTKGDFSILKTVQSAMGSFLSPKALTRLSKGLIGDIAAGGGVGESFFARIAGEAGIFGKEVADLARKELSLANATKAMEDANKKFEASQAKAGRLVREYNKLVRDGASEQELAAKLAEVRAAEEEQIAAAAEKQQTTQDVGALQEQVELQKALVDQLAQLFKMQEKGAEVAKSLGNTFKGLAENVGPGGAWDISSKIGEAIERMKERLKAAFADIFKPLTDAWTNIQKMIFGQAITIEGEPAIVGGMVQMFEQMVHDIKLIIANLYLEWNTFKTNLAIIFLAMGLTISGWVTKVSTWFTNTVPGYIAELILKMTEDGGLIPTWEALRDIIGAPTDSVITALTALNDLMGGTFIKDTIAVLVDWIWKKKGLLRALEAVEDVMWKIGEAVGTLVTYIQNAAKEFVKFLDTVDNARNTASPFIENSPSPLERGISGAAAALPALTRQLEAFSSVARSSMPVSSSAQRVGGTSYDYSRHNQASVTIGPNSVQSPVEFALFEQIIRQEIKRALGARA